MFLSKEDFDMSDATNTISDENSQERPLGLSTGTISKKKNAAVDSLTKSNSRNADTKDDAQHMKKLRNGTIIMYSAVINPAFPADVVVIPTC